MAITEWTAEERQVTESMRERVSRGAEMLDTVLGIWAEHIDPVNLDMGIAAYCIVGQLEGRYPRDPSTYKRLPWSAWLEDFDYHRYPQELGFELSREDRATSIGHGALYSMLRDAWLYEIERRAHKTILSAREPSDG